VREVITEVFGPFYHQGRLHKPLILLFILINGLVLINAVLHDPTKGYDANDHIHYIKTLAEYRRIPTCADSAQCYIPPLPYILPAILFSTGRVTLLDVAKFAQLVNVLISMGLTYYILKICALIDPDNVIFKWSSLAMFGILPVYYKTFSLIRGEIYLALIIVFMVYLLLSIFLAGKATPANLIFLGIAMGMAILARQWGLLVLPAILVFLGYSYLKDHSKSMTAVYAGVACLLIPFLIAGWYYYIMVQRYGTLTAWDRPASKLSVSALPMEFYFGLGSGKLFTDPIRPSFSNQFPAIFYADTWGDYSAYFLVYARDKRTGDVLTGKGLESIIRPNEPIPDWLDTNRFTINAYLGRVNLISLIPTAIFVIGLIYAVRLVWRSLFNKPATAWESSSTLFLLIILCSLGGYGWYLLRYQNQGHGGDLIKASHMMQIFPFLGLLAGQVLQKAHQRMPKLWLALMIVLGLVFLHNLPAMITHYVLLP
jgi:hypothetical protein